MPRKIETTVYTIEEHPNPNLVFGWIRDNWYDLGQHVVEDAIDSLKAFTGHVGIGLDYSLSISPCRSEHITFGETNATLGQVMLSLDMSGNCPFTGVTYDEDILDCFRDAAKDANATLDSVLRDVEYRFIKMLHDEGDYIYSDEGLRGMCEANGYEFNGDGSAL